MKTVLVTLTLLAISLVSTAHAGEFSMNATSCTPDSSAIQGNHYLGTGGTVKHSASSTTTIVLYCPVSWSDSLSSPTTLRITYQDSTATANNFVKGQLIKMSKTGGGITTMVTVSSDQDETHGFCNNSDSISTCSATFAEAISTSTNYYYIRIDIARTSTSNNEVFYGVRLF